MEVINIRAHVGVNKRTRKEIERLTVEKVRKERRGMTRRVFKVLIYVLNIYYGFGVKRLTGVIDKMNELLEDDNDNPVFWRQLDHHVTDYLGIPFERESTDDDGNLEEG